MIKDIAETIDQENSNIPGMHAKPKQKSEASDTTRNKGTKKQFIDMTLLIRSIQRSEGNPDCFGRAEDYCDQRDCSWRSYCLGGAQTPK